MLWDVSRSKLCHAPFVWAPTVVPLDRAGLHGGLLTYVVSVVCNGLWSLMCLAQTSALGVAIVLSLVCLLLSEPVVFHGDTV